MSTLFCYHLQPGKSNSWFILAMFCLLSGTLFSKEGDPLNALAHAMAEAAERSKHEATGNCEVALSTIIWAPSTLHPTAEKAVLSKEAYVFHLGNSPGVKVPNPLSPKCLCSKWELQGKEGPKTKEENKYIFDC